MPSRVMAAVAGVSLYLGLNPALQRRVDLDGLKVGSVNRARSSASGIGGKGQGSYVAALQLATAPEAFAADGAAPPPRLCQFLGAGSEGDLLAGLLRARAGGGAGVDDLWVRVATPCRICTTLVDVASGDATEIVEPSGTVALGEWSQLLDALSAQAAAPGEGGVAALALMGTAPPGFPKDGYAQICGKVCGPNTRLVMDSVVEVKATLSAAAERIGSGGDGATGGIILKLNAREVLKLVGHELAGSDSQVAADPRAVASACAQLAAEVAASGGGRGIDYICYTDGPFPGGVVSVRSGRTWRVARGKALRGAVVSPIGAGDATAAGTLHAWSRAATGQRAAGDDDADARAVDAFRFGLSVGAASCLTGENSVFDIADVRDIYSSMLVSEV
mmetsp:Transcript_19574/g.54756  ORF Transcript_19574/g.54756 Transcript_19574/m.54756 type:complete len:390 (+) Transcript_19574:47-1216(+)